MTSSTFADYVGALHSLRDASDEHHRAVVEAARVGTDYLRRAQSEHERVRSTADSAHRSLDRCRVAADRLKIRAGHALPDPDPIAPPRSLDELDELLSGIHRDCESTSRDLDWVDRMTQQSKDQARLPDASSHPPGPAPIEPGRTPLGNLPARTATALIAAVVVVLLVLIAVLIIAFV